MPLTSKANVTNSILMSSKFSSCRKPMRNWSIHLVLRARKLFWRKICANLCVSYLIWNSKHDTDPLTFYQFDVNVIGVVHTINTFLPLIRAGSTKKLITISSGIAESDLTVQAGFSVTAPYSISKAAVNMVVAKYAAEYKKDGLIFLALSPGLVNTQESTRKRASLY